ncbi:MAG: phosphoribosylaminoimidazolesuccinocarboxamide synthase [Candidatus Izemoplasmatales bacterium]|jgi:phosphoribosylaminoimidazole-succinocarboxamide synthase|nr:phosphoribosylaminoimidazolesuccinocarboxamide synthase [Candidatus Izemoplasmatales bacterium]MDD4987835.1 phosphoribosylaminoimidazolesuccinocarboxamide synthase [Candidatus Izemoplasmatales bacterium]MDD5602285.1 phosphoribosylaminoimidazolesuccinocarboxamide synthase [Candidatus Izemoplasmatales bacterium]NLF49305.1 phosphoribosylaminoimidazolesuccinocarboxamide synthase [Acholeplasmataceae bacterium]
MIPEKQALIYEGKAKQVYSTTNPDDVIIRYKDDATAFNGIKKSTIANKGLINNEITSLIFEYLAHKGIVTHLIQRLDEREQLCKKVHIIKVEVIIRNVIAGSMAKRLGLKEGMIPPNRIYEMCYKNDEYQDPLINEDHAVAMGIANYEELDRIKKAALKINQYLYEFMDNIGIILVDLKLEFGKDRFGNILLADEISPDTCRFWDKSTQKKLDKDRFRRDLGNIEEAYEEIRDRIKQALRDTTW